MNPNTFSPVHIKRTINNYYMRTLKCVIVEDSNVHRILLERLVEKNVQLQLYRSFNSGSEALSVINKLPVDLIFLDIEMPIMNGFEFLRKLKVSAQVIIISQNPKYALEAFDYNATDFLLKPYSKNRFDIAIGKAIEKFRKRSLSNTDGKLMVKHNLKQVELNIHTIHWVEALGDYVKVITPEKNYVILSTMSAFHERLKDDKFVRIHKSFIINLNMVERYNHEFIEIKDKKIPISRTKNLELDKLLNCVD
ncbi:two component transcriptional regulator, LytTR family [Maribacter sedimenticola]|uniref:Two component transcriptional regulator, LytTR family n=2 Tax=Maribacter sedimenticola TaxID=228956 RepID=A0ABY1SFG8_9FLAO|nr:two component transcriptional regulator, LytTR family [Maribacter sedimenticola]